MRCDNTQTIMDNTSKVSIRCLTIWKRRLEWEKYAVEAVVVGVRCSWARKELAHRPLFVVRTSVRHRRRFSTGQPIVTTKNCEGEAKLRVLLHTLNIDRVYPRVAIDVRP